MPDKEAEHRRLATLYSLGLLDTPPEREFDQAARVARRLFDAPIALISLVDRDRQWFKARIGMTTTETPRAEAICAAAVASGEDVFVVEDLWGHPRFSELPAAKETPAVRFYASAVLRAPDRSPIGALCVIDHEPRPSPDASLIGALRDLADLVEREIAVREIAVVDELTGLRNRRGFEIASRQLAALAQRLGIGLALIYLDVDDLKPINDRFGHDAGDAALRCVGAALDGALRRADILARLGGDEFAAVLTGLDAGGVGVVEARVRAALHGCAIATPAGDLPVGVSLGCAYQPPGKIDLDELRRTADGEMYAHKRRKKDRAGA